MRFRTARSRFNVPIFKPLHMLKKAQDFYDIKLNLSLRGHLGAISNSIAKLATVNYQKSSLIKRFPISSK